MFQLNVIMGDLYGSAQFDIDVPNIHEDVIQKAIEDKYAEWSKSMSHQGAGPLYVYNKGVQIVTGSIVWWWNGSHTLRLY